MTAPSATPIFICSRDRVTCLAALVDWLERAGHQRITIIDNASTYGPLLDYLVDTSHRVVRLDRNLGARAIWAADLVPDERFVYTDPDVVPTDDCPADAVAHLGDLLDRFPDYPKAALGLYVDDLPRVPAMARIAAYERNIASEGRALAPGVYASPADTTFALYRAGAPFGYHALRTGSPYEARHLGWYAEADPTDEDRYYLRHAKGGPLASSWAERAQARP